MQRFNKLAQDAFISSNIFLLPFKTTILTEHPLFQMQYNYNHYSIMQLILVLQEIWESLLTIVIIKQRKGDNWVFALLSKIFFFFLNTSARFNYLSWMISSAALLSQPKQSYYDEWMSYLGSLPICYLQLPLCLCMLEIFSLKELHCNATCPHHM